MGSLLPRRCTIGPKVITDINGFPIGVTQGRHTTDMLRETGNFGPVVMERLLSQRSQKGNVSLGDQGSKRAPGICSKHVGSLNQMTAQPFRMFSGAYRDGVKLVQATCAGIAEAEETVITEFISQCFSTMVR